MRLGSCKSHIWNDYLTFLTDNRTPKQFQHQRDFCDHSAYDASLTDLPIIFANLIISYTKEIKCFRGDCILGMKSNINILS